MAEQTFITPEIKSMIGKELQSAVCEVEKGAIRKLANAIGDPNPLWQDEEYARKSRYGGIIAPPTFVTALPGATSLPSFLKDSPLQRVLNAGNEIEFFNPIRPGDTMSMITKLADAYERVGKDSIMVFIITETTCKNQRGEVTVRVRNTTILR